VNFGQTIWDKTQVLLGSLGEILGTWWECIGNNLEKQKIPLAPPLQQEKKPGQFMSAC